MSGLIRRAELFNELAPVQTLAEAYAVIQGMEEVDAAPVRHGRWIYHIDDLFPAESTQECNQCHEEQPLTCGDNFCPNCGALMDAKDGDENGKVR